MPESENICEHFYPKLCFCTNVAILVIKILQRAAFPFPHYDVLRWSFVMPDAERPYKMSSFIDDELTQGANSACASGTKAANSAVAQWPEMCEECSG